MVHGHQLGISASSGSETQAPHFLANCRSRHGLRLPAVAERLGRSRTPYFPFVAGSGMGPDFPGATGSGTEPDFPAVAGSGKGALWGSVAAGALGIGAEGHDFCPVAPMSPIPFWLIAAGAGALEFGTPCCSSAAKRLEQERHNAIKPSNFLEMRELSSMSFPSDGNPGAKTALNNRGSQKMPPSA